MGGGGEIIAQKYTKCRKIKSEREMGQIKARAAEEGQSTGQLGVLAGKGRLESLLGDVFVVSVRGVLGMNIILLHELIQLPPPTKLVDSKHKLLEASPTAHQDFSPSSSST